MLELVEYAELKAFLKLEEASISSYPDLKLIRESVYYAIQSYLNRKLEYSADITETWYTSNGSSPFIPLHYLPIVSVISVSENINGTVSTLTEDTDFYVNEQGLELNKYYVVRGKYVVNYQGGYASDAIPAELTRAALLQTVNEYQAKDNIGGTDIENEGGIIRKKPIGLLSEVKRLLLPLKHNYYLI